MAFAHGKKARFFANGFDLTAYLKRISTASRVDTADTSVLGTSDKTYIVGQKDATLHAEGLLDQAFGAAADRIDDVFAAALGGDTAVDFSYLPQGDTQGAPAFGFQAHETSYEVGSELGDAVRSTLDAQSNVGREALKVHHVLQAEGALGSSATVDNGASSANGGVAYLHAVGTGPIAAVTAKIRHSADDAVYADLITFTAFTTRAHERRTVAGTVNRYTKGNWDAASAIPFWLGFGRK